MPSLTFLVWRWSFPRQRQHEEEMCSVTPCTSHSLNSFCPVAFVQILFSSLYQVSSPDLDFICCFLTHILEIPISHAKCPWSPSLIRLGDIADTQFTALLLTIQAHLAYYPFFKYYCKDTCTHKYCLWPTCLYIYKSIYSYILILGTYSTRSIVLAGRIQTWRIYSIYSLQIIVW